MVSMPLEGEFSYFHLPSKVSDEVVFVGYLGFYFHFWPCYSPQLPFHTLVKRSFGCGLAFWRGERLVFDESLASQQAGKVRWW